MPLLLLTPPTAEPITLAEAKAHLRQTINDDDAYITALIIAARRAIETRYGLCLMRQSWALFADDWPEDGVFAIPRWPLISADGLTSFADDDTASTIDPAHYVLDAASRPARLALRRGRVFAPPGRKINGLKLAFTAGFGADASFVPQEIKQALMATIADWYQNRGDEAGGTLPATALELLAGYRNARLA
jgi:uncharacterized phiE125 gp8 family phage protein